MNPKQPPQFTAGHHQVYEKLRQVLMNLHAQGIPGMDQVLNALNKVHVGNIQPTMPQGQPQQTQAQPQPQQMQPPTMPQGGM